MAIKQAGTSKIQRIIAANITEGIKILGSLKYMAEQNMLGDKNTIRQSVSHTVKVPVNFKNAPNKGVGSFEKNDMDNEPIRELNKAPIGPQRKNAIIQKKLMGSNPDEPQEKRGFLIKLIGVESKPKRILPRI